MEEMKSTGKEETDADQLEQILPKEIQNWEYVESYLLREDQGSRSSLYHANYCDVQMDELSLEKAYSIEYYKRLFYPEIPCKQCEHCWRKGY